ncbi:hypothetical protein [Parvibaculum sp.]|uniref:hypothetical protein n=1 Tax=Parvibaculum sp. TaxID=2024848 RepID=UPI001B25BB0C|nr:hypothetical protein [Parvibaculum sp.]MBO6678899.1 hypothetical protein [Parvibaculum sp.]MBO6685509.1 hypothetical protein [Parvibaculum sp.]MBO6903406.1 hypothetical protein [Parvibaculum sp.]
MSLEKIHLRKLLQIFYAPNNKRISILRADIRQEISKGTGLSGDGGDFHTAFWSGAKRHALGAADLRALTEVYIERSPQRKRLYPLLRDGFLLWWDEKRRWRNEPFEAILPSPHGRLTFEEPAATVKVENLLSLEGGDHSNRLIYPYFSEEPRLSAEAARLGLWLMSEALPHRAIEEMRVLDVIRGASFGIADVPFQGDEQNLFLRRYGQILNEWHALWKEYD